MTDSTMSSTTATAATEKRSTRTPLAHPDHAARSSARETTRETTTHDDARPGMEPWVKPMLGALVPVIAAFYVPQTLKLVLFGVTGVLFAVALVLLVRQEH